MADLSADSSATDALIRQAASGDPNSFEQLFERHRGALRSLIRLRLDDDLARRVDVSDVIQETHLIAFQRFTEFSRRRPMPFGIWLRRTALEHLAYLHRYHVRTDKRSVRREYQLPERSSIQLAQRLLTSNRTPSRALEAEEEVQRLRQALQNLSDTDREILLMRYVEHLSNKEAAILLGVSEKAASKRHGSALLRLRRFMKP